MKYRIYIEQTLPEPMTIAFTGVGLTSLPSTAINSIV